MQFARRAPWQQGFHCAHIKQQNWAVQNGGKFGARTTTSNKVNSVNKEESSYSHGEEWENIRNRKSQSRLTIFAEQRTIGRREEGASRDSQRTPAQLVYQYLNSGEPGML